jgi:hypothetical protein
MAALTQDRTKVHPFTGYSSRTGTAGETIAPGSAVYLKAADNLYWRATNIAAASAEVVGIALTAADANQTVWFQTAGTIDVGGTTVVGTGYWLGAVDEIVLESDLGTGDWATFLGIGTGTASILMGILVGGNDKP